MDVKKKKRFLNLAGSFIVIAWLVMIGVLVKKTSFNNDIDQFDLIEENGSLVAETEREWMEIFLKGKRSGIP